MNIFRALQQGQNVNTFLAKTKQSPRDGSDDDGVEPRSLEARTLGITLEQSWAGGIYAGRRRGYMQDSDQSSSDWKLELTRHQREVIKERGQDPITSARDCPVAGF